MATYVFRCNTCGDETQDDLPIGTATRTKRCVCGRPARLVLGEGLYVAAAARPTSADNVVRLNARERRLDKDGPAYRRMRHRGLQPAHIDGCARLENEVGDQTDIDHARAIRVAENADVYKAMTKGTEAPPPGGGKERVKETIATFEVTHGAQ